MSINSRIAQLRRHQKMSLGNFGLSIGYSKSYICMIENAERGVSTALIDKIVKRYCVSFEWLLTGTGDMYNAEMVSLKDVYLKMLIIARRHYTDCQNLKRFILNFNEGKPLVLDMFPGLTLDKFLHSDIEPIRLIEALSVLYNDIAYALNICLQSLRLIKNPEFANFYGDNKTEISKIEQELLACHNLVNDGLTTLKQTTDNNELLDIFSTYLLYFKQLSYKENIEVIGYMHSKLNKSR